MRGHVTVQRQVLGQAGPGSAREAGSRDAALDQPAAGETTHYTLDTRGVNEDPGIVKFHKLGPHG